MNIQNRPARIARLAERELLFFWFLYYFHCDILCFFYTRPVRFVCTVCRRSDLPEHRGMWSRTRTALTQSRIRKERTGLQSLFYLICLGLRRFLWSFLVGKPVAALAQGSHCIPQVWEDHGQERMLTVPAVRIVVKVEDSFGFATLLAFPPLSQEFCHRPARRGHVDVSVDELLERHLQTPSIPRQGAYTYPPGTEHHISPLLARKHSASTRSPA